MKISTNPQNIYNLTERFAPYKIQHINSLTHTLQQNAYNAIPAIKINDRSSLLTNSTKYSIHLQICHLKIYTALS